MSIKKPRKNKSLEFKDIFKNFWKVLFYFLFSQILNFGRTYSTVDPNKQHTVFSLDFIKLIWIYNTAKEFSPAYTPPRTPGDFGIHQLDKSAVR